MKKKLLTIILSISLVLTAICPVFADDEVLAYGVSLARVNAMYDYLDEVYLTNDLAFDIDYCSPEDIEELTNLAYYITDGCSTDYECAVAIYTWMENNLAYKNGAYSAIDVFRNLQGICSGQAQFGSALLKCLGIRSAIIRGTKMNCKLKSLEFAYNRVNSSTHEWVMAYCDNDWYLFDNLWDNFGVNDRDYIAEQYFTQHVDGIIAYSEDAFLEDYPEAAIVNTYYIDGEYVGRQYNTELNNVSGAWLAVGGCLKYSKQYTTNSMAITDTITWLGEFPNVYKYNGLITMASFDTIDGQWYMLEEGAGFKINDEFLNNGLTNGKINMHIGETFDLNEFYSNGYFFINNTKDILSVENGIVTVIAEGEGEIRVAKNGIGFWLNINAYGDIIESHDLFQELCDHDCAHCVGDSYYCDYCGLLIEEETEVVEEETETAIKEESEVIESTAEETVEETITEETLEEVTEEIVEETIEEEIATEEVEEPAAEEVEETITEPEVIEEVVEEIATETIEEVEETSEVEEIIEETPAEIVEEIEEVIEETSAEEDVEEIANEVVEEPAPASPVPTETYSAPSYTYHRVSHSVKEDTKLTLNNIEIINTKTSAKLVNNSRAKYYINIEIINDTIHSDEYVEELLKTSEVLNMLIDFVNKNMLKVNETVYNVWAILLR